MIDDVASSFSLVNQYIPLGAERVGIWEALGIDGQRAIILHQDDLGMSLAANRAFQVLGYFTGSVMMPGAYASQLREGDLGVHLTLTSEWPFPRMRPLTGGKTLRDSEGCFWSTLEESWSAIDPDEAEQEMRAQIEAFMALGLTPTHLDSHMGAVLRPDISLRYLKLAEEYRLPCLVPDSLDGISIPEFLRDDLQSILDQVKLPKVQIIDTYLWPTENRVNSYVEQISMLEPGVYHWIHHAAAPGPEVDILADAKVRVGDFLALNSDEVRDALSSCRILTYREVRDAMRKFLPPP